MHCKIYKRVIDNNFHFLANSFLGLINNIIIKLRI